MGPADAPPDKKRQEVPVRGARAKSGARPHDAPPVLGDDSAELCRHERDRHAPHHRRRRDAKYCSAWACSISWIFQDLEIDILVPDRKIKQRVCRPAAAIRPSVPSGPPELVEHIF